jgi:hypothetical protein
MMGKIEIEQFLTFLAIKLYVSPTTQNQAFNALLFLYEHVLNISLKDENIQALREKLYKIYFFAPKVCLGVCKCLL